MPLFQGLVTDALQLTHQQDPALQVAPWAGELTGPAVPQQPGAYADHHPCRPRGQENLPEDFL